MTKILKQKGETFTYIYIYLKSNLLLILYAQTITVNGFSVSL